MVVQQSPKLPYEGSIPSVRAILFLLIFRNLGAKLCS